MDGTEAARREAERIHRAAVAAGSDPGRLLDFVRSEAARRDLEVYALPAGDSQLKGGRAAFDSQAGIILCEDAGSDFDRAFLIAHELGHVILEGDTQDLVTMHVEPDCSIEDAPIGIEKVIDYGARERREVRMDIFARELLLPRSVVRHLHMVEGLSSGSIATRLGMPLPVVQQQLLDGLLMPVGHPASESTTLPVLVLIPDPTQIEAAAHRSSPFQLQAGPGTGKTRTLVRRIESLLAEGVDPKSILVLTFSNKAAGELSERLAASDPTAATAMWIGTFHAFGLDIVRRFHDRLGLPPDPRLIDRMEAIEMLEDELTRLPLRHFRNLWDPALDLNDMLHAISRAKDEVVDATGYRALAQVMKSTAGDGPEAIARAEKCLEVALLFEAYQRLMTSAQSIDFGDLVALPVRLVEADAEVRASLRARHQHVLVDEYQDVNRASVRLLKAIVGDGRTLWVVGDARQSIYRFRGASATNMALFAADFPGAKVCRLGINYRSVQEIVDVFTTFSARMKASEGALPLQLTAIRGASHAPAEFMVAGSTDDEISTLAASVHTQQRAGTPYRAQAVLCASNARLSEIARGLEDRGIPILHLGSFFERSEIKDLLALVSMLTDPHAVGLVRVATMPAYAMPLRDVMRIIEHLRENQAAALDWRQAARQVTGLNAASQAVLARVADLFDGLKPTDNPWTIFVRWVIDGLGLAKAIYETGDPQSRMKGLALWQFLNFCRSQPGGPGFPNIRLLDRIRRLVLLNEDRGLRQLPTAADGIDAVRLMTIHGSKGLEFDIVHIPGMVAAGLPRNNMTPRCIPPDGLIYGSMGLSGLEAVKAGHDEEEECLFFVALSRARDRLFLYASSEQSDGRARNESKFIPLINRLLARPTHPPQIDKQPRSTTVIPIAWEDKPIWTESQVNLFERCPRRFLYTHVLKLGGRRSETAFMKMHNVVSDVFDWLKTTHATTNPNATEVDRHFDEAWQAKGAPNHGYAEDYRRIGRHLVDCLIEIRSRGELTPFTPMVLGSAEGDLLVVPDSVARVEGGQVVVRRVKTGKPRSNAFDDIEYTILHLATVQTYGGLALIEVTYLTSETTEAMTISARKLETRRHKVQDMMRQIHSGDFAPKPEARSCPTCPSFFICGSLPSGAVTAKIS